MHTHTFTRKSNLNNHVKVIHNNIKDYSCDLCAYEASSKGALFDHNKAIHSKIKDYSCDLCDYKASVKRYLKRHMAKHHSKIGDRQNEKCLLCEFTTDSEEVLTEHLISTHVVK